MDTRSLGVDWDGLERLVEQSDMPTVTRCFTSCATLPSGC